MFSLRIAVPAVVLAAVIGAWIGGQPADAFEPQTASGLVAKATLTNILDSNSDRHQHSYADADADVDADLYPFPNDASHQAAESLLDLL